MTGTRATLTPPSDAARVTTDRGTFAWWQVAPHVYATCMRGHMTRDMSDLLIARADPMYGQVALLHGIHDWLMMTGYETSCRTELTAWVLRNKPKSALHIGVTLPLVAMGVTVANLALGNLIHVHRDKRGLERAMSEAVAAP
ncbi:MAG TPA: hypothetical protein VFX59_24450 [Polyangiales bacterium]|nr:hypothetical protein [Polyangiales bacterium]